MNQLTRREFCQLSAALGATALATPKIFSEQPALRLTLAVNPAKKISTLPRDYMGLSYESGQLAYPDYFSAGNTQLIALFRALSPSGVLRLGGNLSEFTVWSETEPTAAPEAGGLVGPDPGVRKPRTFTITPKSIRNLKGFLDASGWRCIYGLNLGGGTVEQAVAEGSFVAKTLGEKLISVQFGNEPDLFKHHDENNRPWSYEEYLAKWKSFRAAFHAQLPAVAVAGPDTAYNHEWVSRFVKDVPKEVMLVTSHYYPLGPPTDPKMTIDLLLHPSDRFESSCHLPIESARAAGIPFRMAEGNSCYNAGKPGVSDTFAAALWAGDYCLQMAALGCVGVNLHAGANGYYSPIVGSVLDGFTTRPEYYGLQLAQEFAGASLCEAKLEARGANVTAYAAADEKKVMLVVLFNKEARAAEVEVKTAEGKLRSARVERLSAPAIDSKSGVTFGDAGEKLNAQNGKLSVHLPGYSAAVLWIS
jgi:hypothetical protein